MKKSIFIGLLILLSVMSACANHDDDFILGEEIGVSGEVEFLTQKKGMLSFNVSFIDDEEILRDVRLLVLLEDGTIVYVFEEKDGIESSGNAKHLELYYLSQSTTYYFDFSGYYTDDKGEEIRVVLDSVYHKTKEWSNSVPSGEIVNSNVDYDTLYFDFNVTNEDYIVNKLDFELYDSNLELVLSIPFNYQVIYGISYENANIIDLELETNYTLKIKVYYLIEGVEHHVYIDSINFST